jgi:hypothetical protein
MIDTRRIGDSIMGWAEALKEATGYELGKYPTVTEKSFKVLFHEAYRDFKATGEVSSARSGGREVDIYKDGSVYFCVGATRCIRFDAETHIAHVMAGGPEVEMECLPILAGNFGLAGIKGKVSNQTQKMWEGIIPFL